MPSPPRLDDVKVRRYGRQILLDAVGGRGQRALLAGRVLVSLREHDSAETRAAALIAIAYLAGAGVGALELRGAFGGAVRESDLGILLERADLGRPLLEAIARQVAARNPDVRISPGASSGDAPDEARGVVLSLEDHGVEALLASPEPASAQASASSSARALWRGGRAATRAIAALLGAAG